MTEDEMRHNLAIHYSKVLNQTGLKTDYHVSDPLEDMNEYLIGRLYVNAEELRTTVDFNSNHVRVGGYLYAEDILYADPDFETRLIETVKEVLAR